MNQLQSKENHPVLALTMGDPNGIGAEVMLKALDRLSPIRNWKPLIFGDFRVLEKVRENLGLDLDLLKKDPETVPEMQQEMETQIPVLDLGEHSNDWQPGTCSRWGGESAFRFLNTAILWTQQGRADAIVTAPLNKEALKKAGHDYPGHTDILAEVTGHPRAWMML
ncbi:MAG: 4-hydroxythreonine-4-phosphate dehydrogenase PdxA [Deltaproteobacteria bacterium]